jgi:hypothetical protein
MAHLKSFHFGIDYGTSASKLVVRHNEAPGGDYAELVPSDAGIRHPATVTAARDLLYFGPHAEEAARAPNTVRYDSLKMRIAADAKRDPSMCFAPTPALPDGFTSQELGILSLWWLLTTAHRHVSELVGRKRWFSRQEFKFLVTLGLPTSFFGDAVLRQTFWEILEGGRHLLKERGYMKGALRLSEAYQLVQEALAAAAESPIEPDQFHLRQVLRPEAEAALWWAVQSPAVPAAPFIKLDVGAGTTNVSFFRMVQGWSKDVGWLARKDRLCFFGAASVPRAMDSIDETIARVLGDARITPLELRGRESRHLDSDGGLNACAGAIAGVYSAVQNAWRTAFPRVRNSIAEMEAWKRARVVAIGGGCLIDGLRERLSRHPHNRDVLLDTLDLEAPPDLHFGRERVPKTLLPFAAVAYGLANLDPAFAQSPAEIEPIPAAPEPRPALSHEDLYTE